MTILNKLYVSVLVNIPLQNVIVFERQNKQLISFILNH